MSIFSEKLSELMKQRNMSDEDLGSLVGVNRTTITRWRTGERSPKMEKLPEIASVFNVDPRIFVGESPNLEKKEVTSKANSYLSLINTIFPKLETHRQKKVCKFIEKEFEQQNSEQQIMLDERTQQNLEWYAKKYGIDALDDLFEQIISKQENDKEEKNSDVC